MLCMITTKSSVGDVIESECMLIFPIPLETNMIKTMFLCSSCQDGHGLNDILTSVGYFSHFIIFFLAVIKLTKTSDV